MTQVYNENELYHYGVKGMKWGVRRARAKEARSYQKQLNTLDKQSTKHVGNYMKADVASDRIKAKGRKYMDKHDNPSPKNIEKMQKLTTKLQATNTKRDNAKKAQEAIDSKTWKVMAEAASKGYSINSKQVNRDAERGRTTVQVMLAGPLGHVLIDGIRTRTYASKYGDQAPWAVQGNKYKVR